MTNVFDITDFGAVPYGKTDSTAAVQNALGRQRGMYVRIQSRRSGKSGPIRTLIITA
ncbi:MAG: glycoside hydrolase family 55 protein [Clostridia bacterium]|nr:glycoside hydrolase family 55 protein [Clostridia bacterium]